MANARNQVIAGDYSGYQVFSHLNYVHLTSGLSDGDVIILNKATVENYELITDDHYKSVASGVVRGFIGGTLFGPTGLIAGGLSAKSKGIYQIALQFKDGKQSLIEVNDKIYKSIICSCF